MAAEHHKPYNEEQAVWDQRAKDAFFASTLVQRFLLWEYGITSPRVNPDKTGVDLLATSFEGPVGIELEVKRRPEFRNGRFDFPDVQVPWRKIEHFEGRTVYFVMFDEPREWALVWDCSKVPYRVEPVASLGNEEFLKILKAHLTLIKVREDVPGPEVAFRPLADDEKEVDLSDW